MKAIAVLNWQNLSVAQEISKASSIVVAMTNNENFPTPNPTLADVSDAIGELQNAQQQVDANGGGKVFITARDSIRQALRALMSQLVAYVNNIANGDAAIILSAALELKKPAVRKGKLGATDYINVKGIADSEVKVNWGTVDGAATYHVQMSNDVSPLAWQEFAGNLVTDTKAEVSDLPSGEKLWFRVIAVNSAGEGAPSNPAMVRVP
jgi:hypothetical protein